MLLGSPDLTAGIPGDGDLSVEQIKAWFDKPGTLEKIEVDLPLGLVQRRHSTSRSRRRSEPDVARLDRARAAALFRQAALVRWHDQLGQSAMHRTRASRRTRNSASACAARWAAELRSRTTAFSAICNSGDGRAGTLEEQAKGPIANPIEMANTHEQAVATVKGIEGYRVEFLDKVFGGSDGSNVNIDNIAKAIATFERAIVTGPSPFDYNELLRGYASSDEADLKEDPEVWAAYEKTKADAAAHPMSESALRGREIFFTDKGSCTACHVGPNLSDELYHNLGVGMDAEKPDLGRHDVTKEDKDKGSFKTPTIRNVSLSAPYMHDGSHKTLEEVVAWYDKGGHPSPTLDPKIKKLNLTDQEKADLVEFMKACTGDFPKIETDRLPSNATGSLRSPIRSKCPVAQSLRLCCGGHAQLAVRGPISRNVRGPVVALWHQA